MADKYKRNVDKWREVVTLRASGFKYQRIADVNGISRQRAWEIVQQAKTYAQSHNDELAEFIREKLGLKRKA